VSIFEKLTQPERLRLVIARFRWRPDGHTYQMLESLAHTAG
jgi:hypothetical protein